MRRAATLSSIAADKPTGTSSDCDHDYLKTSVHASMLPVLLVNLIRAISMILLVAEWLRTLGQ